MQNFDYEYRIEKALNLAMEYKKLKKAGYRISDINAFLPRLFSFAGQPIPNSSIYKYFKTRAIIDLLYTRLCYYTIPQEVAKKKRLKSDKKPSISTNYFEIRRLDPNGAYPNTEINNKGVWYFNYLGSPLLITDNYQPVEDKWCTAEYAPFTRQEVRIACAIICSHEYPIARFYFGEFDAIRIDEGLTSHVDENNLKLFLASLYLILISTRDDEPHNSQAKFRFVSYEEYTSELQLFLNKFSICDNLLLRTASHLVKAGMLKTNYIFFEETLANSYFALEGCMLLLQRKHGMDTEKLHRKELRQIFIDTFKRGEEIFDYLSEVIDWGGKRAELVHPGVVSKESWIPSIFGDDHEYHDLTIQVMYYIVTGKVIKSTGRFNEWIELVN